MAHGLRALTVARKVTGRVLTVQLGPVHDAPDPASHGAVENGGADALPASHGATENRGADALPALRRCWTRPAA